MDDAKRRRTATEGWKRAWRMLVRDGVLLQSDRTLPDVARAVSGGEIAGSWWAHEASHAIYDVCERFDHHADVATARLIDGKVTYVHRRLWPSLVAIGQSHEAWQTHGLSDLAREMLELVDRDGELMTSDVPRRPGKPTPSDAARQLEQRLLVQGVELHTVRGHHEKQIWSWARWRKAHAPLGRFPSATAARTTFEKIGETIEARCGARLQWPWTATTRFSRRSGT